MRAIASFVTRTQVSGFKLQVFNTEHSTTPVLHFFSPLLGVCALALLALPVQADTKGAAAAAQVTNIALVIDRHMESTAETLQILAETDAIKSGDWEQINTALLPVQSNLSCTVLWFGYPDGSYAVAGRGFTEANLQDRAYFADVMAKSVSVGELVISRSSGKKSCIFAIPVLRDGAVVGFIGASLFLDDFSDHVQSQVKLPESVSFFTMDGEGQITLAKDASNIFRHMKDAGDDVSGALTQVLSKEQGTVEWKDKGMAHRVVFGTCRRVHWKVLVYDLSTPQSRP